MTDAAMTDAAMTDAAPQTAPNEPSRRLRMKDLCERSGLDRQAIHFYIREGLLPPGEKTGRNTAFYTEDHVERLAVIRRLQKERFLPLKAIKALLDGPDEAFTAEQQRFLADVRTNLEAVLPSAGPPPKLIPAKELVAALPDLDPEDIEQAVELGLIGGTKEDGELRLPESDTWLLELLAKMRAAGFSRELGFGVADLAFYQNAIDDLFRQERRLLSERLSGLPAEQVADMIAKTLPLVQSFLSRYHASRVRDFFGASTERP